MLFSKTIPRISLWSISHKDADSDEVSITHAILVWRYSLRPSRSSLVMIETISLLFQIVYSRSYAFDPRLSLNSHLRRILRLLVLVFWSNPVGLKTTNYHKNTKVSVNFKRYLMLLEDVWFTQFLDRKEERARRIAIKPIANKISHYLVDKKEERARLKAIKPIANGHASLSGRDTTPYCLSTSKEK